MCVSVPLPYRAFEFRDLTFRVQDLEEVSVSLEPFFVCPPGGDFEPSKFYVDLLASHVDLSDPELAASYVSRGVEGFAQLRDPTRMMEATKRAMMTIPFILGEGLEIGVQGYVVFGNPRKQNNHSQPTWARFNLVSEQKRKAYSWYDDQTREGKEVGVKTVYVDQVSPCRHGCYYAMLRYIQYCQFTGKQLDSKDLVSYFAVGGKGEKAKPRKVQFSPEELRQIKTFGLKPGEPTAGLRAKGVCFEPPHGQVSSSSASRTEARSVFKTRSNIPISSIRPKRCLFGFTPDPGCNNIDL
jgi:hypothetical protein